MVKGDVLLCLRCTDVLGPCAVCDGPTSAPLDVEGEGHGTAAPSRPPVYCFNCADLYCLACASGGGSGGGGGGKRAGHPLCPYCEVPLQPRPDPGEDDDGEE